jgi:hypothetical protein
MINQFDVNGSSMPQHHKLQLSTLLLVGAPFHFYFGLNNGKTAIDKFVKLYVTYRRIK